MTFYLTDESDFVATYGPSSNTTFKKNNDTTMMMDHQHHQISHRGGSTPTGSLSPPRTRLEPYVKNHHYIQQQHQHPQQQQQQKNHIRNKSSGGMSFTDAFSYIDSICSGSQDLDETVVTMSPPPSVLREASPTLSLTPPMTPTRPVLQQKQLQQQQQNLSQSRSSSLMTPTSATTVTSSSSTASFSPKRFNDPQPSFYTLQLQQKAAQQAQIARRRQQQDHTVFPKVTAASTPFEKMIAPSSYLYGELLKDDGYRHALQCGILWQSLCSQHVHFPALWYDGDEPARPPMGCNRKTSSMNQIHSQWKYFGRHRVQSDIKLNRLIGNRGSSGRLLLHIIVTPAVPGAAIADVCVGCFHPNARGIRMQLTYDPALEQCRDVWTGYRQRSNDDNDKRHHASKARIEELLQHYNKGLADKTPLGGAGSKQQRTENINNMHTVDNHNLKAVFGARQPLFTLFISEPELYDVLQRNVNARCPASIVLMRQYMKDEEI